MVAPALFLCLALLLPATISRAADATNAPPSATVQKSPAPIEGSTEWLDDAFQRNDRKAIVNLASNYFTGNGVPQDTAHALQLFISLAVVGDSDAERFIGFAYAKGIGVPADTAQALDWFKLAARSGDAKAEINLGEDYLFYPSAPGDFTKGYQWISRSAAQGYVPAEADLGRLYEEGIGVAQDRVESLKWLLLAAAARDKDGTTRLSEVMALADPTQITEAKQRAQAFKPQLSGPFLTDDSPAATCALGGFFQVPVTLFDQTASLLVDTGTTITCLNTNYADRVRDLNVMATNSPGPVEIHDCPPVFIGGRRFAPLLSVITDLGKFTAITGASLDGILGLNLLKNYVVAFDFDSNTFTLGGAVAESLKKNALAVPLKNAGGPLYGFDAFINGHGPFFLAIDTGYDGSIVLNPADWRKVFPQGPARSISGKSMVFGGKTNEDRSARLQTLSVRTNTYTNLVVDTEPDSAVPSRIGQAFLRRHLCAIDFPNRVLYLLPGRNFNRPEEADMSGLSLLNLNGRITVDSVADPSPAFAAGIRAHDQCLSFNGRDAAAWSMKSIRDSLKTSPGDLIKIDINRGGQTNSFQFRLTRRL